MLSHLAIKAKGRVRTLREGQAIDIEFQNPMWNDTSIYSYPVDLPFEGNRDILKNVEDVNSDIRPITLEHEPMQILADGVPLASGPMVISEDEELTDGLSVNIDSAIEDFKSIIGDLTCREVPIPESDEKSLIIGEIISDVNVDVNYYFKVKIHKKGGFLGLDRDTIWRTSKNQKASAKFQPQALGFSYPAKCVTTGSKQIAVVDKTINYRDGITVNKPKVSPGYSYINVTDEYGENKRGSVLGSAKFCNARVCYKHYDKGDDGKTSDKVVLIDDGKGGPEDRGPYWVLDADRPQSGICFYVLYFLECLFKHLGVSYDISELLAIEDMKHLCFYTTKCSYKVSEPIHGHNYQPFFEGVANSYDELKNLFSGVNEWLDSRGCGGHLELERLEGVDITEFTITNSTIDTNGHYKVGEDKVDSIRVLPYFQSAYASANISNMIADNGNFPKMSVSSLLSSLENMFGIKFSYDYEQKKVTAYLLRDALCTKNTPRQLHAQVLSMHKVTEKITGVRVGYSEEADAKEQRNNIHDAVKKYNTSYDYIDYPDPATASPHKTTVINLTYADFFRNPNHGDEKTYIDQLTGNAYRIKIDENYTNVSDMHPALFEVGQFKGVEEGDCASINEDFIKEFRSDLVPVIFSDVNYYREKNAMDKSIEAEEGGEMANANASDSQPLLAAFMDEDMEHEFIEQRIRQNLAGNYVNAYFTEVLTLRESYDPTQTDDGNSPLQHYDWGNSIAMMRGGGADSTDEQYDSGYDGFGNNKWLMRAGLYALTSDSIDQWQNVYDYNGKAEGGYGGHFSLKPRAYKQPSWAKNPLCVEDKFTPEHIRIRSRGYVDTFLLELIYFLLNRKKYRVRCLAAVAQIADIPNHWKEWWLIDGKKCLIDKVNTQITVEEGMGEVELDVYSL